MSNNTPTHDDIRHRDEAVKQGGANAHEQWLVNAQKALAAVARQRVTFHSGHVWDELERREQAEGSHDGRAMATVMKRGQRAGVCKPTNQTVQAKIRDRHATSVRVWESSTWGD